MKLESSYFSVPKSCNLHSTRRVLSSYIDSTAGLDKPRYGYLYSVGTTRALWVEAQTSDPGGGKLVMLLLGAI